MTTAIQVDELHKSFRVRERARGFRAAVRGLIAPASRLVMAVEGLSLPESCIAPIIMVSPAPRTSGSRSPASKPKKKTRNKKHRRRR